MENLTRKAQLQEIELDRTTKQLKEALAFAEDEAEKCRAAKDVIKSLTAQVRLMFNIMGFWITVYMKSTSYVLHGNREESFFPPKAFPFSQFHIFLVPV